jgi:hypothetical protein
MPVPVPTRFAAGVFGLSIAVRAGLNSAEGLDIRLVCVCCVVSCVCVVCVCVVSCRVCVCLCRVCVCRVVCLCLCRVCHVVSCVSCRVCRVVSSGRGFCERSEHSSRVFLPSVCVSLCVQLK